MPLARRLGALAALAEPARRDLYLYVISQSEPVSRDQAAIETGLPRHAVKFHLDRLVEQGLLDIEFRRLTGRSGPGAGRPAKLYRRAPQEVSVSLPERRYDLAGQILADAICAAVADDRPVLTAVAEAAAAVGRRLTDSTVPLGEALAACGYEPRSEGARTVLANCPFHALARAHSDLVCGMNLALVSAMARERGLADVNVQLSPAPGRCCVVLGSRV